MVRLAEGFSKDGDLFMSSNKWDDTWRPRAKDLRGSSALSKRQHIAKFVTEFARHMEEVLQHATPPKFLALLSRCFLRPACDDFLCCRHAGSRHQQQPGEFPDPGEAAVQDLARVGLPGLSAPGSPGKTPPPLPPSIPSER